MDRKIEKVYLMHKDHTVAELELGKAGDVKRILFNKAEMEHIPLGGQMNNIRFHDWWKDRATPKTRQGATTALERLGYTTTNNMLVDNLALSLTDCYWIKPYGLDVEWKDVNLFTNPFEDVFGSLTFNPDERIDLRNKTYFIPASSQGEVQKKWCIDTDGTRFLVKGNYGDSFQQSINEVFASMIHQKLGFQQAVQYSLTDIELKDGQKGLGCSCDSFCSENVEAISAWEVLQLRKNRNNESFYYPLRDECIRLGIREEVFDNFISYEIMTDFLMSNTDRHMNNISILRNPDTLEVIGMAPIYDTGNSMFYNSSLQALQKGMRPLQTNSFIKDELKLLKYVTDRHLVDLNKLQNLSFDLYEKDIVERQSRIPHLKYRFEQKMYALEEFQQGRDIWKSKRFQVLNSFNKKAIQNQSIREPFEKENKDTNMSLKHKELTDDKKNITLSRKHQDFIDKGVKMGYPEDVLNQMRDLLNKMEEEKRTQMRDILNKMDKEIRTGQPMERDVNENNHQSITPSLESEDPEL